MKNALLAVVLLAAGAVPAHAELVFFATGRNLSVKSHHLEGNMIVLEMRGGGEMTCETSLVDRIEPDEVPYPEPPEAIAELDPAGSVTAAQHLRLETNARFDPIIQRVAREQGVDASIVRAVIQVESGYEPRARSRKGAIGLMQVMPATARQYGLRNPYDPAANIEVGSRHLKSLLDRLPLKLALAAYNAGEATVQRFRGVPPYAETEKYVSTILALLVR
jgi:transglycosylase-like protein with SLT domain